MVTSTTSEQYGIVIKQLFCFTHERVSKCVVLCQYSVQNTKASSKCYSYTITIVQCSFTTVIYVLQKGVLIVVFKFTSLAGYYYIKCYTRKYH
jgi:hypothetical protein